MLPIELTFLWQQLFNLLSTLSIDSILKLKVTLRAAIDLFESQILTINLDDLPDPIAAKMRSYTTETHRLLRLLPMDVMFITAARNDSTRQQRRQAYQDKLDLLLRYCQGVEELGDWKQPNS